MNPVGGNRDSELMNDSNAAESDACLCILLTAFGKVKFGILRQSSANTTLILTPLSGFARSSVLSADGHDGNVVLQKATRARGVATGLAEC